MFSKEQIKKISNIISNNVDRTRNTVYFEKLKNDARSIKIWGWEEQQYSTLAAELQAAGYTVNVKKGRATHNAFYSAQYAARLHISV